MFESYILESIYVFDKVLQRYSFQKNDYQKHFRVAISLIPLKRAEERNDRCFLFPK